MFSLFLCAVRLIVMQFNNGSVNCKHACPASSFGHLLDFSLFLLLFEKLQMPHVGAGRLIEKPHGGA